MMKKTMLSLVAVLGILMISGCSTPVYENRYAMAEGWRVGKVTKLVTADEFLKTGGPRCPGIEILPTDQIAFVQRQVTRTRGHFAKVDPDSGIAVGDEVYYNAWDCDQPQLVPRLLEGL